MHSVASMQLVKRLPDNFTLHITAVFVFLLIVARAALQSITIDEATTYELWVLPNTAEYWNGASNNHILNSLIISFFTSLFGLSHLTMRSAAILGALLYIWGAHVFCRMTICAKPLRWAVFTCLVANPFILDYLIAARGYSLAMAFLLWTILVPVRSIDAPLRSCMACSALAALTIAANFSFGVVACVALLAGSSRMWRQHRPDTPPPGETARAALVWFAATAMPGLLVSAVLTAHAVLNWPSGQLWWGARSLWVTLQTVAESSLYRPNAHLVNPFLLPAVHVLRQALLPLLIAITAIKAILMLREPAAQRDDESNWRREFALLIGFVLGGTIALHWLASVLFGILLPQERTALYIPVLVTALTGVVAGQPLGGPVRDRVVNRIFTASLLASAVYFTACLRLSYFKEWEWDADVQHAFAVVARNFHTGQRISSSWHYTAPLNFYRKMSGNQAMPEIVGGAPVPSDADIFVVHGVLDRPFIEAQRLAVIYEGESTELVVAVRFRPPVP